MLALSCSAAPVVAKNIGYSNVQFLEGLIETLDNPQSNGLPLIPQADIDVVFSNCVLNLVNCSARLICL
ncbi:hypothetical protein OMCYN_01104 [cyanobiont of Ornithocercus magnificus]|nr:hypothetical protein OMCYN_01104 [cyanobiont of Ornithocercus magnificus]